MVHFTKVLLGLAIILVCACSSGAGNNNQDQDTKLPQDAADSVADVDDDVGDSHGKDQTTGDVLPDTDPDEVDPGCKQDDDCLDLQGNACQKPRCNSQTGECELEALPDCAPCSTPQDCPAAPLCYRAVCVEGRCGTTEDNMADCDDGNECTQVDKCLAGECQGAEPVICQAPDECHQAGQCLPATGECSAPVPLTGTPCNDSNACTQVDQCSNGVCEGTNPVECVAMDQCHEIGECDSTTGACSDPPKEDLTPCDDSSLCTLVDQCIQGVCTGSNPVLCKAADQCHVVGECEPNTGACTDPPAEDGVACDDADKCTTIDKCFEGVCTGTEPVICQALDQCHIPGTCDPETGDCDNPNAEDNTPCSDNSKCTTKDVCVGGLCEGTEPVICKALSQCHSVGECNPETGYCSNPVLDDGADCEEGDLCTVDDVCIDGICMTGVPKSCKDSDQCTNDYCEEGECINNALDGCIPEDCSDEVDNNGNNLIDCDDPLCAEDEVCSPLAVGETCGLPYLVNDGNPVGDDTIGLIWEATGDTTGKSSDYPALCWQSPGVPDEVYKVVVQDPVRLRVSFDFTDPNVVKWSRFMIFKDVCFPDNFVSCAYGGSIPADYEDVFLPGTYYFVVTGSDVYSEDWGPYTFSVEVYTVETTETDCQDLVDNDGNGLADCADPQCYEVVGCEEVVVLDHLECGDTWTGEFLSLEESHYFTFEMDEPGNVAVYWVFAEGAKDYGYINFYEAATDPPRYDELWGTGKMVWHTANGAGFEADANTLYVAMFELSKLDLGTYNFTLACSTVPEFNCDDSLDNDADSWIDCEDPDCYDTDTCNGGFSGETCETAIPLHEGAPVTAIDIGDDGLYYTIKGRNDTKTNELSASCVSATSSGPDIVYTFTLEDFSEVGMSVQFDEDFMKTPAIYLFQDQCNSSSLIGCGETVFFMTGMSEILGPGTYYLVVDSGGKNFSGVPHQDPFTLDIYFDPPPIPEDCSNTVDDDGDGRLNCQDPECFDEIVCVGNNSGEHCGSPFQIYDGQSLPENYSTLFYNTTIGKSDDLGYSCAPVSWDGPDTAHHFYLDQERTVTISVQFDDGFTPAMILFGGGGCGSSTILHCITAEWDTATISEVVLPAGHYHVVVDSGDALFGKPQANHYALWITTTVEDCSNTLDDDGDGFVDCQDSRCFGLETCNGGFAGEDCTTAYPVNSATALAADQDYTVFQTTIGKANDLSATCSAASSVGPDSVHYFILDAPMSVSASVQFYNQTYPALYIYSAACTSENLVGCDLGTWSVAATDNTVLAPGTYYVVVDSGQSQSGTGNTSDYRLNISTK